LLFIFLCCPSFLLADIVFQEFYQSKSKWVSQKLNQNDGGKQLLFPPQEISVGILGAGEELVYFGEEGSIYSLSQKNNAPKSIINSKELEEIYARDFRGISFSRPYIAYG